jgi:hypothetical protein
MRHGLLALLASLSTVAGASAPRDPPLSAACREALDALQAQEGKAMAARQGASSPSSTELLRQLEPWRRQAARACLGGQGDAAPPTHSVAPPAFTVTPSPVRPLPPATVRTLPGTPLPPPPAAPATITSCDPNGCWTSDGSRLQRMGPNLVGPRGMCSAQGVLLHCP